jgi:hypothetical protein
MFVVRSRLRCFSGKTIDQGVQIGLGLEAGTILELRPTHALEGLV